MTHSTIRRLMALPIAVALVAASLLLYLYFYTGDQPLLVIFVLPIVISTLLGGLEAGLISTLLSGAAVGYFLLPPLHRLSLAKVENDVQLIVFLATGVAVAFLVEATGRWRRRIARENSLLGVTLASIGDAVIVTDNDGRIAFLNGEAERLTHWPGSEALGRRLRSVFTIRNGGTGKPAESPVDRVLRLRTVVSLANDVVLVARDGREIPIDGSGAPVRERDGTMQGAVIVFRDITERRRPEEKTHHLARHEENDDEEPLGLELCHPECS